MDQTETLSLGDYNDWGEPAVMYVNYCLECAREAHQQGRVLYGAGEENKWLGR